MEIDVAKNKIVSKKSLQILVSINLLHCHYR